MQYTKYDLSMNYSFENIDIILLAMIAGFIFLRLRGILGKKTGFDTKTSSKINQEFLNDIVQKNHKIKLLMKLRKKIF